MYDSKKINRCKYTRYPLSQAHRWRIQSCSYTPAAVGPSAVSHLWLSSAGSRRNIWRLTVYKCSRLFQSGLGGYNHGKPMRNRRGSTLSAPMDYYFSCLLYYSSKIVLAAQAHELVVQLGMDDLTKSSAGNRTAWSWYHNQIENIAINKNIYLLQGCVEGNIFFTISALLVGARNLVAEAPDSDKTVD
jgi:hypothetical protein